MTLCNLTVPLDLIHAVGLGIDSCRIMFLSIIDLVALVSWVSLRSECRVLRVSLRAYMFIRIMCLRWIRWHLILSTLLSLADSLGTWCSVLWLVSRLLTCRLGLVTEYS